MAALGTVAQVVFFILPLPRSRLRLARACTHARMAKRCPFSWHAFLLQPCNISSNHCIPAQPALHNFCQSPHLTSPPSKYCTRTRSPLTSARHQAVIGVGLFLGLAYATASSVHHTPDLVKKTRCALSCALPSLSSAACTSQLPNLHSLSSLTRNLCPPSPPLTPIVRSQLKEVDGGSRRSFG